MKSDRKSLVQVRTITSGRPAADDRCAGPSSTMRCGDAPERRLAFLSIYIVSARPRRHSGRSEIRRTCGVSKICSVTHRLRRLKNITSCRNRALRVALSQELLVTSQTARVTIAIDHVRVSHRDRVKPANAKLTTDLRRCEPRPAACRPCRPCSTRLDAMTAAAIESGDWASLGPEHACGYLPIAGLLMEANRRNLKARQI